MGSRENRVESCIGLQIQETIHQRAKKNWWTDLTPLRRVPAVGAGFGGVAGPDGGRPARRLTGGVVVELTLGRGAVDRARLDAEAAASGAARPVRGDPVDAGAGSARARLRRRRPVVGRALAVVQHFDAAGRFSVARHFAPTLALAAQPVALQHPIMGSNQSVS